MAIVSRRPRRVENETEDVESVMTAAAGGLRQRFMRKVAEISHGGKSSSESSSDSETDVERNAAAARKDRKERKRGRKGSKSSSSGSGDAEKKGEKNAVPMKKEDSAAEKVKKDVEARKGSRGIVEATKLTQLEQSVPADAQMPAESVGKVGVI